MSKGSPRYVAISPARGWSDSYLSWQDRPTCQVIEGCPSPRPTGLLDATGAPLYRLSERIPLGFHNRLPQP